MKSQRLWKVLSFSLLGIGLGLLWERNATLSSRALLHDGVQANGIVVGYETETKVDTNGDMSYAASSSEKTYYARVRFQPNGGKPLEFLAQSSASPTYRVNSAVTVVYDPRHPSSAKLQTESLAESRGIDSPIPGVMALFLGGAGLAVWLIQKRRIQYQSKEACREQTI